MPLYCASNSERLSCFFPELTYYSFELEEYKNEGEKRGMNNLIFIDHNQLKFCIPTCKHLKLQIVQFQLKKCIINRIKLALDDGLSCFDIKRAYLEYCNQ